MAMWVKLLIRSQLIGLCANLIETRYLKYSVDAYQEVGTCLMLSDLLCNLLDV